MKGKKNVNGKQFTIRKQLPDEWVEENRQLKLQVNKAKKVNEAKSEHEEKDDIQVKNRTLYINKIPQRKSYLEAPRSVDIFVDRLEQEKMDKIKFHPSATLEDGGSSFTSYAVKLQSMTEVRRSYIRMRQLHPTANHIIAVYKIKNQDGFQDDHEFGAGFRLLSSLIDQDVTNAAIFTVRYSDSTHISPKRHFLMNKTMLEALQCIK